MYLLGGKIHLFESAGREIKHVLYNYQARQCYDT